MKFRSLIAVLALAAVALTVRAADEENPYKKSKVGDFATYTMTTKVGGLAIKGVVTQTVIKKEEKEATLKVTGTVDFGGKDMEIPAQEEKIDLTKPYSPAKAGNLPGGAEAKVEKQKEGKEKIKVGEKEYDCTWTTYKMNIKVMGQEIEGDMKTWTSKDVPGAGMVKMTMIAKIAGQEMETTMELKETGNKK